MRSGLVEGMVKLARELAFSRVCAIVRQVKWSRSYAWSAALAPARGGTVATATVVAVCVIVTRGTTPILTSGLAAPPAEARYVPGAAARKRTVKLPSGRALTVRGGSLPTTLER